MCKPEIKRWFRRFLCLMAVLSAGCAGPGGGGAAATGGAENGDRGGGDENEEDGGGTALSAKMALWTEGARLRGANIWQARNISEVYGENMLGTGAVGPPFVQDDFDALADLGANYVNISHPGVFTEKPPYELEEEVQANLDHLLEMIEQADMFAVITFRTGPGRSEFTFVSGEDTESDPEDGWFDPSYYNDSVWEDREAQAAWADMWRHTAERYGDHPIVTGYDLLCEPNAEEVFLEIWGEPEEFYPAQAGTTYDWNTWYPELVTAIREVDPDTPILVQPMGYGSVAWLPFLEPTDAPAIVYTFHQYEPSNYTHQEAPGEHSYPGEFDVNGDGVAESVNREWLDGLLETVDDFAAAHGVTVAVNEYGLVRWVDGNNAFMDDLMGLLDDRGINQALWDWSSTWEPFAFNNAFNFRFGPDPENAEPTANALQQIIEEHWAANTVRPSNMAFTAGADG